MSWKSIICRAESLLGGRCPSVDFSLLGKSESNLFIERIRSLASMSDHKIISVIYTELENSPHDNYLRFHNWTNMFSTKKVIPRLPSSMVIPLVGQCVYGRDLNSLQLHRKMGEIFAVINLAIALHKSVVDLSDPQFQHQRNNCAWVKNMESGNKLAVLAGDILLANSSVELASFRIPKVVELISGAIAEAVCAEFTDLATDSAQLLTDPSSQWLDHAKLRHGALLGECCAAASLLSSPLTKNFGRILKSAREFGINWASLSRLLSELDYIKELKLDIPMPPKTLTSLGFTDSGLPEPTLADALLVASEATSSTIYDQYKSIASKLARQLGDSLWRLLEESSPNPDVYSLAKESVDLLVKEAC
nr:prenyl (decaprenyl) diphosphate synthase [Hymenolepis microstoma]